MYYVQSNVALEHLIKELIKELTESRGGLPIILPLSSKELIWTCMENLNLQKKEIEEKVKPSAAGHIAA